jgi:hypothetical protein
MTNGNELVHSFAGTSITWPNLNGLTKREYFAAMAMQGLLARQSTGSTKDYADIAVNQADALITELNKPQP